MAATAAYSNHFGNSFHFDDSHTVVDNLAIRDLRNVPRFFTDARTFSVLPTNQSYRPLVSTLLAIAYATRGALDPVAFHVLIFALVLVLLLLLQQLFKALLGERTPYAIPIATGGVLLFALHPASADTVNYVIASSEILSTLAAVGSVVLFIKVPAARSTGLWLLPALIGMLAKPTAIVALGMAALYAWIFRADERQTKGKRIAHWSVAIIVCTFALLFLQYMTPPTWVAGAATKRGYWMTQPYVAWQYLTTFVWPAHLSADYDLSPLATMSDRRSWIGLSFGVLINAGAIVAARFRPARLISFGLLWFIVGLVPTSLTPLAEVMNDHRTFLPYIGLVIAVIGVADLIARHSRPAITRIGAAFAMLVLASSGYATYQRNRVWRTEETLWADVVRKSPRNGRGLMNYGNTLMARGDLQGALDLYHRALAFTPAYPLLFVNLALAEDALGQTETAEAHFQKALTLSPAARESYTYYGDFLANHGRVADAAVLREREGKAAQPVTSGQQTADLLLTRSLDSYRRGRFDESIAFSRAALKARPDYAEAWNNIGAALNNLGRYDEAKSACKEALRLKPELELARGNLSFAEQKLAEGK